MKSLPVQLQSHFKAYGRAISCTLLCVALVAPKISLAFSAALAPAPLGYRTVVICTGSGLSRVTVSPDGQIVSDFSKTWHSPHCVSGTTDSEILQRAWQYIAFPSLAVAALQPAPVDGLAASEYLSQLTNRGPPH